MTTVAIKKINELSELVKAYKTALDAEINCKNNAQYDVCVNEQVDIMRLAKSLAEDLAQSLAASISIEAEVGGHCGTTKSLTEIKNTYIK